MSGLKTFLNRLPLRTVLTIPFVVQVVGVVGVVGYLSFKNGQTAVTDLASQLQSELTDRILRELQATVERPYIINQLNKNSLLQGDIDVSTGKGEHLLWQQAAIFPTTNLVYCSTEANGDFLGVGRSGDNQDDRLQIQVANRTTDRYFHYYDIARSGRRSSLLSRGDKPYDPRIRPWYEAAKSKRSSVWSKIYLDFDTQLPTITASTPVYTGEDNQLLGVCATDIILSKELSSFLENLKISESGIAFIMDTSGLLLASSTSEPITVEQGEVTELLLAHESDNRLIKNIAQYLRRTYPNLENLQSSQLKLLIDSELQYLQFVRFDDQPGLEWIIVVIVPEDDFMEQINRNTQITFLLCFVALIITVLLGLILTKWLTQPLLTLSETAKEIAKGEWDKAIELERVGPIGDLSRSFSTMAHQLRESFTSLEQRIEERTAELLHLNQELQRMSRTDELTRTANRRHFNDCIEKEWRRLSREHQPLTLLLCDVDYFKKYNDTYGHQAGDRCLQEVAQVLMQSVQRSADLVARYGGEEFAIILPNTPIEGGIHVAQTIMQTLDERQIPHAGSEKIQVTVSIGIAAIDYGTKSTSQMLIAMADQALYTAKTQGRDRYCILLEETAK